MTLRSRRGTIKILKIIILMKNISKFFALFIASLVLVPVSLSAATIHAGDEVFVKKASPIQDNLYVAGANISVSTKVFGDLLVAGGSILVSDDISSDIAAAGGSITILGNSGGDVRIAGGNILISGDVAGDLIIAGGSIMISSDVTVGKDLIVTGGQVSVNGNVMGDAQISGGIAIINGHIKGNVVANAGEQLTLGDTAVIDGNLEYSARKAEALKVSDTAVVAGSTSFIESKVAISPREAKNFIFAAFGAFLFWKFLSLVIVALVLVRLFGKFSSTVVATAIENPLQMLGKGFVAMVVVPAAAVLLFITLFGATLGFITLSLYVLLLIISGVYAGIATGVLFYRTVIKSKGSDITWHHIVVGIALLMVIKMIPVFGWIVWLFAALVVMGSIVNSLQKSLKGDR